MPLLQDCSARFRCKTAFQYDGGDHIIFVGEVTDYDANPHPPLLYVTGGYALASRKANAVASEPAADTNTAYSENLIGYLMGRAHFQFLSGLRKPMAAYGMTDADFYVLSLLSIQQPQSPAEIASHGLHRHRHRSRGPAVADQQGLGGGKPRARRVAATHAQGNEAILHVLAAAKAVETDLIASLGEMEAATCAICSKGIAATDPGLPKLWQARA
jgi:3-hydroxy-9,10-secoandrosta-1,3,5(10)-triene-9,17-dione monooxygenase reductase component